MTTPETADRERVVIRGARVFDGEAVVASDDVVIESDGTIGTDSDGATIVDGAGGILIPGLIDAHLHLVDRGTLAQLARFGVTTGLDMASWSPSKFQPLRRVWGVADSRSAGKAATSPGSIHSKAPNYPSEALLSTVNDAETFVASQVADDVDYIKVISDIPGPSQEILDAVVVAAHRHGLLVIAHAISADAFAMAQAAGVDMVTHAPLDRPLDEEAVRELVASGRVMTPTLTMMEGTVETLTKRGVPGRSYDSARESVRRAHEAGAVILAGTDANSEPFPPASPVHGESLHHELELLVDAGLSNVEALRAATVLPAKHFRLADRGAIRPGLRADLVLLRDDPTADITATRSIERVWCNGVAFVED
jgi:imidazolonepropionase-like amidohydrolase